MGRPRARRIGESSEDEGGGGVSEAPLTFASGGKLSLGSRTCRFSGVSAKSSCTISISTVKLGPLSLLPYSMGHQFVKKVL